MSQRDSTQVGFLSHFLVNANGVYVEGSDGGPMLAETYDRLTLTGGKLYPDGTLDLNLANASFTIFPLNTTFNANVYMSGRLSITTNSTANIVSLIGDEFTVDAPTQFTRDAVFRGADLTFAAPNSAPDVRLLRGYIGELTLVAPAGGSLGFSTDGEDHPHLLFLNDNGGIGFGDSSGSPMEDTTLSRLDFGILAIGEASGYGTANGALRLKRLEFAGDDSQSDITMRRSFDRQISVESAAGGFLEVKDIDKDFGCLALGIDTSGLWMGDGDSSTDSTISRIAAGIFAFGTTGYGSMDGGIRCNEIVSDSQVETALVTCDDVIARESLSISYGSVIRFANSAGSYITTLFQPGADGMLALNAPPGGGLSFAIEGDGFSRLAFYNDNAGIEFGPGDVAGDVFVSRQSPGVLAIGASGYGSTDAILTVDDLQIESLSATSIGADTIVTIGDITAGIDLIAGENVYAAANVEANNVNATESIYSGDSIFAEGQLGANTLNIITTADINGKLTCSVNVEVFGTTTTAELIVQGDALMQSDLAVNLLKADYVASAGPRQALSNNVTYTVDCDGYVSGYLDGLTSAASGYIEVFTEGAARDMDQFVNSRGGVGCVVRAGQQVRVTAWVGAGLGNFFAEYVPFGLLGTAV